MSNKGDTCSQVEDTVSEEGQSSLEPENKASMVDMDTDVKKAQIYQPNTAHGLIKYVSLVVLTVQNAVLALSMSYSRKRDVVMFSSAAVALATNRLLLTATTKLAVLMAEVVKLVICLLIVLQSSGNVKKGLTSLYVTVILNIKDTIRVGVPAFLYIIQNNLLYLSASNLDAATYQVTYQLKLLTTAFFAVIVLKRRLKRWQWCALALLVAGVALVQLTGGSGAASKPAAAAHLPTQSRILGFGAALAACFISGFAGIYFEKVLKESDVSLWLRNVQLSLLSLPFGAGTYLFNEGTFRHLFRGFDGFVWYLVVLQAAGGLIVAVVVKYADNILKGFATSFAIVVSCVAAMYLFDFHLTLQFALGTLLVIGSIFLYGYVPKKKPDTHSSLNV